MIPTTQIVPGISLEKVTARLINRTGGTLRKGGVVALNLDFAATAGQAMAGIDASDSTNGAAGYVGGAAIIPTAANSCHILAVLDDDILADDAEGTFTVRGIVPVGAKSGVSKGDFITMYSNAAATTVGTNGTRANEGAVSGWTRAELDSQQAVTGIAGIALQDAASDTTVLCYFDGFVFKSMIGGGA